MALTQEDLADIEYHLRIRLQQIGFGDIADPTDYLYERVEIDRDARTSVSSHALERKKRIISMLEAAVRVMRAEDRSTFKKAVQNLKIATKEPPTEFLVLPADIVDDRGRVPGGRPVDLSRAPDLKKQISNIKKLIADLEATEIDDG